VLLTAAGAVLKIVVEMHAGQALFTQTAWPSVPAAHAVGLLCGLAWSGLSIATAAGRAVSQPQTA
jgi:hypothetical protein